MQHSSSQSDEPLSPTPPRVSRRPASWSRGAEPSPALEPTAANNDLYVDEQTWANSYAAPSRPLQPPRPLVTHSTPMRQLALKSAEARVSLSQKLFHCVAHLFGLAAVLVAGLVASYRLPIAIKFQYAAAIVCLFITFFLWFSWLRKHALLVLALGLGASAWLGLKTGPPYEWMEPVKPWLPSRIQAALPQAK